MNPHAAPVAVANPAESAFASALARGDAVVGTVTPVLRHLLANDDQSLFSEEIVARLRGMLADLAQQLVGAVESAAASSYPPAEAQALRGALVAALVEYPAVLGHLHAQALEWQLTERLQQRLALDPVLPPLVQALVASTSAATAASAMALLAAQARWAQSQRRMQLPLAELPGDLLHGALQALRHCIAADPAHLAAAEAVVRGDYDESRTRLGLIARIVTGMGAGAGAALAIGHAGVAVFVTALALASGQDRDLAVLSTSEAQAARLALALRASGLKPAQVDQQFAAFHPDLPLPGGIEQLAPDRAARLLAQSAAYPGA